MATAKEPAQRGGNLTGIAYRKIKESIVSNKLKPGFSVSGSQLAKLLNMSRTPIREAVQILASEGLVEIQNGVGFYVKGVTLTELREISEVRIALECSALRKSIFAIPPEQVAALLERWTSLHTEIEKNGCSDRYLDEIVELDKQTHHFITRNCGNSYLNNLLDMIEQRITRIQFLSVDHLNALDTIEQHTAILDAMQKRDLQLAVELLEKHVQYSVSYLTDNPSRWMTGMEGQSINDYFSSIFSD